MTAGKQALAHFRGMAQDGLIMDGNRSIRTALTGHESHAQGHWAGSVIPALRLFLCKSSPS